MAENQIRLSQLIGYCGPGAMLDLPDRSVLVMGLDHWDQRNSAFRLIEEPRLSRLLRLRLQDDTDSLPPAIRNCARPRWIFATLAGFRRRSGQLCFRAGSSATRSQAIHRIGAALCAFNS
jgi:hypothetical protein